MGYGGALLWTALAHDLKHENPERKVIFLYEKKWSDFFRAYNTSDHEIFFNNPEIDLLCSKSEWNWKRFRFRSNKKVIIDLDDISYGYFHGANEEKMFLKTTYHAISMMAMKHGIKDSLLQPRIYLTNKEINKAESIKAKFHLHADQYICLEPDSKDNWTPNRAWFKNSWQQLVDLLNQEIRHKKLSMQLVQMGIPGGISLDGVLDLRGMTSYRECASILEDAKAFISTEGGLAHLSTAVKTKTVVIQSGYNPKELMSYPQNINLFHDMDCFGCGLRTPCSLERECMKKISPESVLSALKPLLLNIR